MVLFDAGVGYDSTVISGPASRAFTDGDLQAGGARVIVTARRGQADGGRKTLGANTHRWRQEIRWRQHGGTAAGRDVEIDCTAAPYNSSSRLEALKRKGGTMVVQGELAEFPSFPLGKMTVKFVTIHSARGHSYRACELALQQIASGRFPLEKITTHRFGLQDVDLAIRSVGNAGVPGVIHASLLPWQ